MPPCRFFVRSVITVFIVGSPQKFYAPFHGMKGDIYREVLFMPKLSRKIPAFLLAMIMLLSCVQPALAADDGVSGAEAPETVSETADGASPEEKSAEKPQEEAVNSNPESKPADEAGEEPEEEPQDEPVNGDPGAEITDEAEEEPAEEPQDEPAAEPLTADENDIAVYVTAGAFDAGLLNGIPATANPGTGTTKWGTSGGYLCSGNQGKSRSTSTLTLTMTADAMISFEYKVSTEAKYDTFTVKHNTTTLVSAVSGVIGWTALSIDAKKGDTITFTYSKDGSGDKNDDTVYLRNFSAGEPTVISFDANGGDGTMPDQNVYGKADLNANTFTKDHAVFIGWAETANGEVKYTDGQTIDKPEEPITLYAVWAEAWVIRFTDADTSVNVRKGEALGEKNVPTVTKTGYVFNGWYNGSEKLDPAAAVTADAAYSAEWSPIHYTIRFDANGGIGTMKEMSLAYDDRPVALTKAIFTRAGYSFSGWTLSGTHYADEAEVCNLSTTDGAVLTFKAEWSGSRVAVHADPNYAGSNVTERIGVVGENYNYIYNEQTGKTKYSELENPVRDGYKFTGWFSAPDGGDEITNQYKFTAEDSVNGITLYAHWVEAATVTFDANGGSCSTKSKIIVKGEKIGYLPTPRSSLNFDGWYTKADGGEKITTDFIVTGDITLYAHYRVNSYYVRFYANKGSGVMEDVLVPFDSDYTLPECTFTREDYVFAGWATYSSGQVRYADKAKLHREFDDWGDSEDGEIFSLYAVWKETVFAAAFKAIEAKLPAERTVYAAGSLGLPASGTGWTAEYTADDAALMTGDKVTALPESGSKTVTVTATVTDTATGEAKSRTYSLTILSAEAAEAEQTLKKAAASLTGSFTPVYGTDTNAAEYLTGILAKKGYTDLTVSVKEATASGNGYASIDADGTIHYYYNPEMTGNGASFYLPIVLSCKGASVEKEVYMHLTWDVERARARLLAELDRISVPEEITKGDLTSLPRYTVKEGVDEANIDYGKYANFNTWATVTWSSSNITRLKIGSAPSYPYYSPYPVTVLPAEKAIKVTLTATMKVNSIDGLTVSKVFEVLIKPVDEDPIDVLGRELGKKLDAALKDPGLRDFVTGEPLDTDHVINDIRFPTTSDIGVDGKYQPVSITSSDESVIKAPDVNNAARVDVIRPLPGKDAKDVTLTITITDKETGASASRDITVTVQPLTEAEIEAEIELMDLVKAHYFDGIKNTNTQEDKITADLHPFAEAYLKDGSIVWVYGYESVTGDGIVPVSMDGWEVEESWRTFRSSNAKVISHENLLVTRDKENRSVTVTSWLSSERYGKYAELYPNDARFAALCKQPVSAELIVLGTDPSGEEEEKIDVSFALKDNGSTWFSTNYKGLSDGTTVFDVFQRALSENGYSSEGGKFVTGVSGPNGTLRNLDRGEYSGWMYSVNGSIPSVLMNEYYVKNGDKIVFFYTDDYRSIAGESKGTPEEVIKLIESIGTVDASSGNKIAAARRAYDDLNAADKEKVTNRSTLFAAEETYANLIRGLAKKFADIYKTTGDYIQSMDESELCSFGGEWFIFALARSERDLPELYSAYYDAAAAYVDEHIDANERLDAKRITENLRLILTLTALEKDVTDVSGHDLLTAVSDMDFVEQQGINGVVFTLLALDGGDYEIPAAAEGKTQTTREALVLYLLDHQLKDGGWAFSGETADPDMTAMVLQALRAYYVNRPVTKDDKAVKEAVNKGIACLSDMQTTSGGYASFGTVNAESAAQVVIALTAYGINPGTDARFIKNGISVLDALCNFYVAGGGFRHSDDGELNSLATAQGYCALTAYWRFTRNKTPLYDMSDLAVPMANAA